MRPPPPVVTGDLSARTRSLLGRYAGFAPAQGDLSDALVEAFARLAGIVADRVNRVPEKNLLAFLELVGVRPLAPQPARVPLTFQLANGAQSALVPAGTAVAAAAVAGDAEPVPYETESDLTVTAAQLVSVLVHEPVRDRYATPDPSVPFAPFASDTPLLRRLYVGFADLRLPGLDKLLTLAFEGADLRWLELLTWDLADGTPLNAATDVTAGTVVLTGLPLVGDATVGGVAAPFVRARLHTGVPAGAVADGVVTVASLAPDAAVCAAGAASVLLGPEELAAPFAPFLAADSGSFALACDDAFSKPRATVTLAVAVAVAVAVDPSRATLASDDLRIAWSYSSTDGWTQLDRSGPGVPSEADSAVVADATQAFTRSGTVTFAVPDGWTAATLGGRTARWLRAEIVSGSYRDEGLPLLASLAVGYAWDLPALGLVQAHVEIDHSRPRLESAFANQQPVDLGKDFFPFGTKPALNDAFYFADDDAILPAATVTLGVALTTPSGNGPPPAASSTSIKLRWEYWDGGGWSTLGYSGPGVGGGGGAVVDASNAFQRDSASIAIQLPADVASVAVNGQVRRWLRARIAGGDYGSDFTYVSDGKGGYALQPASLRPPSIAGLTVHSTLVTARRPVDAFVVETESELTDRTADATDPDASFVPFVPPRDARPALYLGFDRPFGNVTTRLFVSPAPAVVSLAAAAASPAPVVVWEWWDPEERAWTRLEALDETRAFTRRDTVTFVAPAGLGPRAVLGRTAVWLRACWERGAYASPPRLDLVLTNTVWARQWTTVTDEVLGSSTGEPGQRFTFAHVPVLPGEVVEVREPGPAGQPDTWNAWTEVVDFYASGPFDRHYVLDRIAGVIGFGDGRAGAVPPQAQGGVRAGSYRTGGGERGNRPAGAIAQLKTTVPYVVAVTNHEPASAGTDAETADAVVERGPRTLRHGGRAVAIEDFEDLAVQASPDLARIRGIPAPEAGGTGRVALVVVPRSTERKPVPSLELTASVADYLDARVSPTFDLWVGGPGWLRVTVETEVVPLSLTDATDVENAVLGRLSQFLHPLTGGFDGEGWPFGRQPHRSDLETWIGATAGVDHVRALAVRTDQAADEAPPVVGAFLVYSGDHTVTVSGAE